MKKIIIMLLIILGVILPTKVNAITDSFYVGEYLNGEYIVKTKNGVGRYQQLHAFRRTKDNKLVYCIELWEGLNENKTLTGYNTNQNSYANLSSDIWNRVMLLAYYGYGYNNHTDMKWYTLTQVMIWETIATDSDIYFTDTLNGNRIDKYRNERNEIEDLVSKHYILPSFANQEIYVDENEKITITDTNNVLSRFNNLDNYGLSVYRNGSNLTLNSKITTAKSIRLIKEDYNYQDKPIVYIDNDGQDILIPGKFDPISFSVYYYPQKYDITIKKLDKDTNKFNSSLIGTKITLVASNGNHYQTKIIDETGKLIFNNVVTGNYYLKEESTSQDYELNNELIPITVNKYNKEFIMYNKKVTKKIQIINIDKDTKLPILEKEATFMIIDEDNNIIKINTDELGKTEEIIIPSGKYTIKEEKAPNDYILSDDEIEIIVNRNNYEHDDTITIEFPNEKEVSKTTRKIMYPENIEFAENEEPIIIPISAQEDIEKPGNSNVIEVPNTYSNNEKVDYYVLLTSLGIILIKRKKYEKNN